ncbi:MAG: DUF448 domain-containing protein [Candidatus Pacebacteria bacterium]|nr:DUF448 domain-containing protein [Candidatus Paceibacterota bacterium]
MTRVSLPRPESELEAAGPEGALAEGDLSLSYGDKEEKGLLRRSVASGESHPKNELLRCVVSPTGELVFDAPQKLLGRGYYIESNRDLIEQAIKKRAFSRAARRDIKIPAEFLAKIEDNLLQRCLSLIGLARRAGKAVMGYDKVVEKIGRGEIGLLIQASDAASGGRDKLKAAARNIAEYAVLTTDELAQVFGRDRVVHVAIGGGKLAQNLKISLSQLEQIRIKKTEN